MTQTIKLDYPIAQDGQTIEEIALRRPKVRDMLAANKGASGEAEKEIRMFRQSGRGDARNHRGAGFGRLPGIAGGLQGFLSSAPRTSGERS
ncbi:MAG: phage tail assembly protein [Hyphomicrobiales bacterium]